MWSWGSPLVTSNLATRTVMARLMRSTLTLIMVPNSAQFSAHLVFFFFRLIYELRNFKISDGKLDSEQYRFFYRLRKDWPVYFFLVFLQVGIAFACAHWVCFYSKVDYNRLLCW
jgi:hypothetical protein